MCDSGHEKRLSELRGVLVSLREELVALGEARDRERLKGRGCVSRRVVELEEGLMRKEAEVRVIVDLYRQVSLLVRIGRVDLGSCPLDNRLKFRQPDTFCPCE